MYCLILQLLSILGPRLGEGDKKANFLRTCRLFQVRQKRLEFNAKLRENPSNVQLWIEFIDFQVVNMSHVLSWWCDEQWCYPYRNESLYGCCMNNHDAMNSYSEGLNNDYDAINFHNGCNHMMQWTIIMVAMIPWTIMFQWTTRNDVVIENDSI